jgi:hypothetical protein
LNNQKRGRPQVEKLQLKLRIQEPSAIHEIETRIETGTVSATSTAIIELATVDSNRTISAMAITTEDHIGILEREIPANHGILESQLIIVTGTIVTLEIATIHATFETETRASTETLAICVMAVTTAIHETRET